MLGVVAENLRHRRPVEEPSPLEQEGRDVLPSRADVERLVDGQAGVAQGGDDGQARHPRED